MKIKTVKDKQYKTLLIILGGIAFVWIVFIIFKGSGNAEDLKGERYYKKEIATGVEGLSEQEMWIENSTNELNAMKKQNKELQEQIDKIQKVVIGIGRAMNVFDGENNTNSGTESNSDTLNAGDNSVIKSNGPIENTSLSNKEDLPMSEGDGSVMDASVIGMRNFAQVSKNKNAPEGGDIRLVNEKIPVVTIEEKREIKPDYGKLMKSGIKTIKFTNTDNEYDLDENFIFATTYARCVLVGSVTVSAGVGSSSNPQPVLLRLTDSGNLPNKVKGFLKDAMVIGAAYGELSSESVVIRLERIVKIDKHGRVGMDIPVKGYVAGENGDSRIRGLVIDRAGAVVRQAAIGGFFSGIADFLTMNNSSAVKFEPNSGLAQFSPQRGSKMLEQGASKGIGNAVEKYADFYIKRAEQLQPVIQIDGGRKLTIVFTESVKASGVNMKKVRKSLITPVKWGKKLKRRK